ncbi:MAG: adenosine deaminase [Chloroflexi bacterium]|nr:adenosine deaminase [Chloroflexota bacterium]
MSRLAEFVRGLPKAELHLHLEGSLEPGLLFQLASRNNYPLVWSSVEALRAAYEFSSLQSFLALYYAGCEVLRTEQDFYDMTHAYLQRAHADGVIRTEVFIGPQSFTTRGVSIATVMDGVIGAIDNASRTFGISVGLIVSAQRHRTEADALDLLDQVRPWSHRILAIGMGGAELGNPPSKFANFYRASKAAGFRTTIHAGEEGPAAYVREAVELLGVDRIDHGIACMDDPDLVHLLADRGIPLTVCPVSNLRLKVVKSLEVHPLARMLQAGLLVTVNSDDPAYFGAYASDNLLACRDALDLSTQDLVILSRNGFNAAFFSTDARAAAIKRMDDYVKTFDWSE